MKGAFQTSRGIFENPIWNDIPKFRIFFYIYGNAVFSKEGTTVAGMHLKRGQFLRSYRNLRDDLAYVENRSVKQYSLSVIKRKVDSLVKENRLKIEETELGTLFTVINYEQYQGFEHYKNSNLERSENALGTGMERSENNNKNVNKDNNVKEKTTTTTAPENPVQLFEYLLCRLSPIQMNSLYQWVDDFKGNQEIVNAAIKLADNKNKRNFNFVEFLLKEWHSNNLMDIDRVRAYEREKFNNSKVKPFARKGKGVIRTEMLPDWFEEDAQQSKPKPSDQPAVNDGEQMSEFERLMELRKNSGS
ncbi:DnaD domain protein [Cytobacillus sp. OWB-43]|uniref:DnaD domain-containing protein n=1 Tax=Cytobacillus sp. OWB-43 TaxID=3108468 RepID=UPI002AFEC44E|nr:DnaD domain protein [Cytobacillus sp. OWB-43]MEA1855615.1 DnaD domain protein [Cytobacillus sp. OWB-43]